MSGHLLPPTFPRDPQLPRQMGTDYLRRPVRPKSTVSGVLDPDLVERDGILEQTLACPSAMRTRHGKGRAKEAGGIQSLVGDHVGLVTQLYGVSIFPPNTSQIHPLPPSELRLHPLLLSPLPGLIPPICFPVHGE